MDYPTHAWNRLVGLVLIGMLFGASLRWTRSLSPQQVKEIGAMTGGRTLFFGGLLFAAAGIALLLGLERRLPVDMGALLIGAFMVLVAVPAFVFSWRDVVKKKEGLPR